jgi:hypothetical protein
MYGDLEAMKSVASEKIQSPARKPEDFWIITDLETISFL